jgi:multiple sugar transport system substrate-binding protein
MPGWRVARVVTLSVLLLAAGCESTPRSAVPGGETVTIVWLAGPTVHTVSDDVRQVLVDAFEQSHPLIKVELLTGPDNTDLMRRLVQQVVGGGSATPDVYSGDVIWPAQFAQAGLALPLNRYLHARFLNSLLKVPRDAMSYRGQVYGIPYFLDEGLLYYRKDLLKRAGLRPPSTWQQLEHDSIVLHHDGMPYQFVWQGNNYEGLTCVWMEILADAFGGRLLGGLPGKVAAAMASPEALFALNFLRRLIQTGISPIGTDTFQETNADAAFDSGDAAFMRGWDESYSAALGAGSRIATPRDVGVEPPPTFAGERSPGSSMIGGWGIYVNPHSRHRSNDITFATWMARVQAQRILAGQYSQIPSNRSVRKDKAVIAYSPVLQAAANTRLLPRPATPPGDLPGNFLEHLCRVALSGCERSPCLSGTAEGGTDDRPGD